MALTKRALFNLFFSATAFALLVRLVFLEDYRIISNSMVPTLLTGDLVFVSKSAFNLRLPFSSYEVLKFKRPERSEVVAFSLPDRGLETFVKRVVGVEGDRIEIKAGVLYVNGIPAYYKPVALDALERKKITVPQTPSGGSHYLYEQYQNGSSYIIGKEESLKPSNYGPVDVPKGHFFALGDNRSDSIDSRTWGPIPYSCLKGRVALVWMSVNEGGGIRAYRAGSWVN